MTGSSSARLNSAPHHHNETATAFFEHSSAPRINTDTVLVEALRREYPQLHLTVAPRQSCNLLSFAQAGKAAVAPIDQEKDRLTWSLYRPAPRRLNGESDGLAELVQFGKFLLEWKGKEYVLYVADGRDGSMAYPVVANQYILSSSAEATSRLLLEAGRWTNELHDEVWVFDQGFWQKSGELFESIKSAEWENVILDEAMKKSLISDVDNFFNGRATYQKLKVPWKRGVIYYGPPGNGKTISIKAMMHSLYKRRDPVPTLYVKTLSSFAGPEYSIRQIFAQARRYAPCYLIFEDLDSLITPSVRSYFLNEVDGLKSNDGILMVGSTNHIDQLDPGIAKRPSRFDRKYFFPNPDKKQRFAYAKFWQSKLSDNPDIEFPDAICDGVADITEGFSFAYMQEAFIASLLALAGREARVDSDSDNSYNASRSEDYHGVRTSEIAQNISDYLVVRYPHVDQDQWLGRVCQLYPFCYDSNHFPKYSSLLGDPTRDVVYSLSSEAAKILAEASEGYAWLEPYKDIGPARKYTFVKNSQTSDEKWAACVRLLQAHFGRDVVDYKSLDSLSPCITVSTPSFAMAERLVASLISLATYLPRSDGADDSGGNLDRFPLWQELRKQISILKEEMDRDTTDTDAKTESDKHVTTLAADLEGMNILEEGLGRLAEFQC